MFCPQCSQPQVPDEMRFCSRCGFPLEIVSRLIANEGVLPAVLSEEEQGLSPRQRGVRKGAIFLILSVVLTPIVGLMTAAKDDLFVLFLPVLMVFVFGLARLLYALFLEQPAKPKAELTGLASATARAQQLNATGRASLPAARSVPATAVGNWRTPVNTSEMAQPLSVTDNTTKLLHDEVKGK